MDGTVVLDAKELVALGTTDQLSGCPRYRTRPEVIQLDVTEVTAQCHFHHACDFQWRVRCHFNNQSIIHNKDNAIYLYNDFLHIM